MPRQARLDAPGTLHHVILRGIEKRYIVDTLDDRRDFVSRMGELAVGTQTIIYAWVLMTNHAHMLLRSGPQGLSSYMRRLLTGYAVTYNRRHSRRGHLFQNRYKSIVCEEDAYFMELVRYIHLNPIRSGMVKNMSELARFPWCGHRAIIGKMEYEWQDCDYVLRWFGKRENEAKKAYRRYVQEGISMGKRPELVGGGLIRSQGGWSQVLSMRGHGDRELSDERILGSGDFVERIISEADKKIKYQFPEKERKNRVQKYILDMCRRNGINIKEVRAGSRRRGVTEIRSHVARALVGNYGIPLQR